MSCLIIGLTLLGVNAYRKMGIELMPKMDMPYITIVTVYPGASPEQIETDIAATDVCEKLDLFRADFSKDELYDYADNSVSGLKSTFFRENLKYLQKA